MVGMSKSGNHAVIRWVLGHFQTSGFPTHFYNNTTQRFLDHINFIWPDLEKSTKRLLFVSFEDVFINEKFAQSTNNVAMHNILLLRDPLNLFASRFEGLGANRGTAHKNYSDLSKSLPDQINKYINHYTEFLKKTNLLENKVCICYNKWVLDKSYRQEIIEKNFNLKFRDCRFNVKAGSSFRRLEKASSPDDYFNRWKFYKDNPIYKKQIMDNEILCSISKEFGVVL